MSAFDKDQVFVAKAITDTATHNSTVSDTGEFSAENTVVYNGLDQSVSVQLQGSIDSTNWLDIGIPFVVASGVKDYDAVTDYFPCYRTTAKCTIAPSSGTLDVWVVKAKPSA